MDKQSFRSKPVLSGTSVTLRPFAADDVPYMVDILSDVEALQLTGSLRSTSDRSTGLGYSDRQVRDWYTTRNEHSDRLDLAIVDQTDCLVGEIVLNDLRAEDDTCSLRILIGPAGRDRGLGTEAMTLIVDHAFATTDLYRLELEVFAFNPRAQHVYEKVGFTVEGRRRAALRIEDARIDSILMSILRPEWEAKQDAPTSPN